LVEMFVVRDRIKLGLWRESFMKLVFLDHPIFAATSCVAGTYSVGCTYHD